MAIFYHIFRHEQIFFVPLWRKINDINMKSNIIGREKEIQELEDVYNSRKSEFVAICGRIRVGVLA